MIEDYTGDKNMLGNAELFYVALSKLKGYKLRIDAMVLRQDFKTFLERVEPALETYVRTCESLMSNEELKVFLRYILHTGNFMNAVSTDTLKGGSEVFGLFNANRLSLLKCYTFCFKFCVDIYKDGNLMLVLQIINLKEKNI